MMLAQHGCHENERQHDLKATTLLYLIEVGNFCDCTTGAARGCGEKDPLPVLTSHQAYPKVKPCGQLLKQNDKLKDTKERASRRRDFLETSFLCNLPVICSSG